ncbi:TMEM143 family protein [Roseofilum casamattae]|uniref:TMEM143 family protein n=1 Tax=Roseofilum casamattae BLCC-M143 TaxID=3022442 RepID=A0ABT7BZP2_9CYAN|nr:TMEM143 family protein [Roseofilum casamattae]MDJ1184680.1 TMEM143 family protein [Roseofilum casamattae BLCC-M143]
MATYSDREAYIPFQRHHLIELCLQDGQLSATEQQIFREFCTLLSAYYHFQFHHTLEKLKRNYTPFQPHGMATPFDVLSPEDKQNMESEFFQQFQNVLEGANYYPLSQESLERAFAERSLIDVNTDIDFNDFDRFLFYCRGDIYQMTTVKRWFRSIPKEVNTFDRVVLAIKFKDEDYFERKERKEKTSEKLNFNPGKIYLSYYKNIPQLDLELIFPNVRVSMTWKDRLILIGSAIGAAIPLAIKVLPRLLIVISIILFFTGTLPGMEDLKAREEDVRNLTPILLASMSLLITFGGFAFKQYNSYKNKKIKFQKKVTEALFFKSLASNTSVLHALIDAAEEEECKEIILVYYHLLISRRPMSRVQLDNQIEIWMEKKWNTCIDFDINGPLKKLAKVRGTLNSGDPQEDVPLLTYDEWGNCQIQSLENSLEILDSLWDNAFNYSQR